MWALRKLISALSVSLHRAPCRLTSAPCKLTSALCKLISGLGADNFFFFFEKNLVFSALEFRGFGFRV